jgi:hypothetical protein
MAHPENATTETACSRGLRIVEERDKVAGNILAALSMHSLTVDDRTLIMKTCCYEGFCLYDPEHFAPIFERIFGSKLIQVPTTTPVSFEELKSLIKEKRKIPMTDPSLEGLSPEQLVERGCIGIGKLLASYASMEIVASLDKIDYVSPANSVVYKYDGGIQRWHEARGAALDAWLYPLIARFAIQSPQETIDLAFLSALHYLVDEVKFRECVKWDDYYDY